MYHHSGKYVFQSEYAITAFAFSCPEEQILHNSVFMSCRISNKNETQYKVKNSILLNSVDPQVGCYLDDYVGCFPDLNSAYWYNADANDGILQANSCPSSFSYKSKIPVISMTILNKKMDYFSADINIDSTGKIILQMENSFLRKYFNDDGTFRKFTHPFNHGARDHQFSEDPNEEKSWSMYRMSNEEGMDFTIDQMIKTGSWDNNESKTLDFVLMYNQDPDSNHIQNVHVAKQNILKIQKIYNEGFLYRCSFDDCKDGCVWPGDCDNNGRVDALDAVPIFKMLNITGLKRSDSIVWRGMESFDWGTERPGVLNPKFADADGNGVVNVRDLNLLRWYFKYTHNSPESRALECEGNPILKFVKNGNTRMEKTYESFLEKRSIERYNFSVLNSNSDDVILINSLAKTWKDTSVFIFEHHSYEQQISPEKIEVVCFQNAKRDIPIIDTFQQLFYILKAKSTGVVEICDFT